MNKKKIGVIIEFLVFFAILGGITYFYYFGNNDNKVSEESSDVGIIKITDANFESEVLNSDIPVVLEFSSNMCPPCLTMVPTLTSIAKNNKNIKVATMNTSDKDTEEVSKKYMIDATPTIMIFKNGAVIETFIGATSEEKIMSAIK